jgi:hypothetical protein
MRDWDLQPALAREMRRLGECENSLASRNLRTNPFENCLAQ